MGPVLCHRETTFRITLRVYCWAAVGRKLADEKRRLGKKTFVCVPLSLKFLLDIDE